MAYYKQWRKCHAEVRALLESSDEREIREVFCFLSVCGGRVLLLPILQVHQSIYHAFFEYLINKLMNYSLSHMMRVNHLQRCCTALAAIKPYVVLTRDWQSKVWHSMSYFLNPALVHPSGDPNVLFCYRSLVWMCIPTHTLLYIIWKRYCSVCFFLHSRSGALVYQLKTLITVNLIFE